MFLCCKVYIISLCVNSALCLTLYAFSEHNVFAQLLLYRTKPLFSWRIHFISATIYTLTRIFITITFIYCYIEWAMTDEIYNQLNGKSDIHYLYIFYFFLLPFGDIILNIAQYQTVKALFYISKSVYKRIKERNQLLKYPRLQKLYDIFIEFDSRDNGYWTMIDWKKFIFYHSTFIKHDTCIILWNVLGFKYIDNNEPKQESNESNESKEEENDEENHSKQESKLKIPSHQEVNASITQQEMEDIIQNKLNIKKKRRAHMRWKDFRKIFGPHIISQKFKNYPIKKIISAQLQILLQTIFSAQSRFEQINNVDDKDKAMIKLYENVNQLIGKNKKNSIKMNKNKSTSYESEEKTEDPTSNVTSATSATSKDEDIEMIIMKQNDSKSTKARATTKIRRGFKF